MVNNIRFLILPWVNIKYLASHLLSISVVQIRADWAKRYGHSIYLLETFVEQDKFHGVIISDFLSAYNTIEGKKQKCLPHALRIIKRLDDASSSNDREVNQFCRQLKGVIQEIIDLFKKRKCISDYVVHRADIVARCKKLLSHGLSHNRAERLRCKLNKHKEELYTCLYHPSSDFNNNFVERMLRPNVIMRKLTYGNRSHKGIKNHSVVTSILQTSKLNNHYAPDVFQQLLTDPSQVTLKSLIRAPC